MGDRRAEREQRVTPLELFFDLVFVFAITQVTSFLSRNPTWGGLLRALLLLGMLWWAWSAYAWLTNTLDPEEGAVRLAVLAAVAAMLIVSLAAPRALGDDGVIFGVAYLLVRALHLVLFGIAGRGDRDLLRAVLRIVPGAIVGATLLLVAGFFHGSGETGVVGRCGSGHLPRCAGAYSNPRVQEAIATLYALTSERVQTVRARDRRHPE
jgi:low temperature requirement protein LtrA